MTSNNDCFFYGWTDVEHGTFLAEPELNQTPADLRKGLEHFIAEVEADLDNSMTGVRFAVGVLPKEAK